MFGWKSKKMKKLEELETKLDALTNQLSSIQNNFFESNNKNYSDLKTIIEDSDSKTQQMFLTQEDNSQKLIAELGEQFSVQQDDNKEQMKTLFLKLSTQEKESEKNFSELGEQLTSRQNENREQMKGLLSQLWEQDRQYFDSLNALLDIQTQDNLERFKVLTRQVADLSVCEERHAEAYNIDIYALKKKIGDMQSEIKALKINQEKISNLLRDLELRQEYIYTACTDMQNCIVSSEQLLRLLLITNVMEEIPDKNDWRNRK